MFYYEKALSLRKDLPEIEDIGTSYIQIATVYYNNDQFKKALINYKEAINYLEKTNDYISLAIAYKFLAYIYNKDQKLDDALFFLEKAISSSLKDKDVDYNLIGDLNLINVDIFIKQEQLDKALFYCDTALVYFKKTKKLDGLGSSFYKKASIYRLLKNKKKEKEYNNKALEIAEKNKNNDLLSVVFSNISKFHFSNNDINKAEKFALKAMAVSKKNKR